MKKRFTNILLILSLARCTPVLDLDLGTILQADRDGRFSQDLIYDMEYGTLTLLEDGTYRFIVEDFEISNDLNANGISNEGWITMQGHGGSYHYLNDGYILNIHFESIARNLGSGIVWDKTTNAGDLTNITFNAMFTEKAPYVSGELFLKATNETTWTNFQKTVKRSKELNKTRTCLALDPSHGLYQKSYLALSYTNFTSLFKTHKGLSIYSIEHYFPLDAQWKRGCTLTMNLSLSEQYSLNYYSNGAWSGYLMTNLNYYIDDAAYYHGGNFILKGVAPASY